MADSTPLYSSPAAGSSPMLDQYRRIKKKHEGNTLFFRLGDFYEMFAEDAIEVSALLNLTLTSRNGLPMCGIPYHAARSYIARLLKLGKKIAVCEQLTPPGKGNKIIERDVVEIITPGTTVDEEFLEKGSSNYLGCLAVSGLTAGKLIPGSQSANNNKNRLSFSYIDLSTGEFFATSFPCNEGETLRQELERLQIKEILIQESLLEENNVIASAIYERNTLVLNRWADWLFDPFQAQSRLEKQFGLVNLKSFGLKEDSAEIISAGSLLDYLDTTSKSLLPHIRKLNIYSDCEYMGIDEASQRNLELIANQREGDVRFSLLEVMDETRSSMGRRLLKRRILHPLRDIKKIEGRLDMAENLYRDQNLLSRLRELLGKTPDLERLCSRLAMDKAHGRDMLAVKNAINLYHEIFNNFNVCCETSVGQTQNGKNELLFESDCNETQFNTSLNLQELKPAQNLLENGICEEPSVLLNEGNLIKDGYNSELDALRGMRDNSRQILEQYLEEEKNGTGIASLKIRYNRLIGYFFEVTKSHLDKVPKHFIKRQGITGGERYSTDRLASLESEINGASDKVVELERKLFLEIREEIKKILVNLSVAAKRLAEIDVAQSMAKAASIRNWRRPYVCEDSILEICEGRHPVVEAHLNRSEYIPNDVLLHAKQKNDTKDQTLPNDAYNDQVSFAMITGPNMAGKSTYLRSAALITIMAQTGSFVPAAEAKIGICDRIYCRVGASDNLARGESTFLVEMNETAFILNTATEKSLVIMDEVGRGTGTNDGLSIAWAVSEELLNRIGCRTLFATHFHELSLLSHPQLANRSMEVLDQGEKIVFLRKLKEGPAAESYGIHVAHLAGISQNVLKRAAQIMSLLKERDEDLNEAFGANMIVNQTINKVNDINKAINQGGHRFTQSEIQERLNDNSVFTGKFERLLQEIDPEQMTPLEALNILCQWKKLLETADIDEQITFNNGLLKTDRPKQKIIPKNGELTLFD
ncbi:MAG: DNA mismatch repair protein MutS [Treponema sp.]|nr:DNA mismatch repair protein MutS [Treponema sp.]